MIIFKGEVMKRYSFLLLIALCLSPIAWSDAAVRLDNPMFRSYRLDWCKDWGTNCGKPAADQYCKNLGYASSISFAIAHDIGNTRLIGNGAICSDAFCDGFEYIVCRRNSETFNYPRYRDYNLDWCKDWAKNCGKPAADAYCVFKGYNSSYDFALAADIGNTRLIGSGAICSDSFCDGFSYIRCN